MSIKAYICVQILLILMQSVGFSERRPEEVISFFWRSVYVHVAVQEYQYASVHENSLLLHNYFYTLV